MSTVSRIAATATLPAVSFALSWEAWSAGRIPLLDAVLLGAGGAVLGVLFANGVRDGSVLGR